MWVCLVAKHDGSVANSEHASTPRRPAASLRAGRGLGSRLIAAGDGFVEDEGAHELAGR